MSIHSISSFRFLPGPMPQEAARPGEAGTERQRPAADGGRLPPVSAAESRDPARVEAAVSQISEFVQNLQRDLQFSVDENSGRIVIKVIDSNTQEVIREIPPEHALRVARNLEEAESLMLREQA